MHISLRSAFFLCENPHISLCAIKNDCVRTNCTAFAYPLSGIRTEGGECSLFYKSDKVRLVPDNTTSVFVAENFDQNVDDRSSAPTQLLINLPFKEMFNIFSNEILCLFFHFFAIFFKFTYFSLNY